jgi:hypothetical protein
MWLDPMVDRRGTAQALADTLAPFDDLAVPRAFRADLLEFADTGEAPRYSRAQLAAHIQPAGLILGIFSAAYNGALSLEAIAYEHAVLPPFVRRIPSSAVPILVRSHTSGFDNGRYVALFPEEVSGSVLNAMKQDKAFYFIDRFTRRSMETSVPIACRFPGSTVARLFAELTPPRAEELATTWVWLHEHFHRVGPLPLPSALEIKRTRSGGALEELRTDLRTIIGATDGLIAPEHAADLANYVLGERLLRYGMEGNPADDYDARSSHIFFGMLQKAGALGGKPLEACLDATTLLRFVAAIVHDIEAFEEQVKGMPCVEARRLYADYAESFLLRDARGAVARWPALERGAKTRWAARSQ